MRVRAGKKLVDKREVAHFPVALPLSSAISSTVEEDLHHWQAALQERLAHKKKNAEEQPLDHAYSQLFTTLLCEHQLRRQQFASDNRDIESNKKSIWQIELRCDLDEMQRTMRSCKIGLLDVRIGISISLYLQSLQHQRQCGGAPPLLGPK